MANAFTFQMKGLDKLQQSIKQKSKEFKDELDGELERACQGIVNQAKVNAPKNISTLTQSIGFTGSNLSYLIRVGAKYGHIMEFGSKTFVKVPSELTSYAAQFKGQPSGGDFATLLASIKIWVKRKGIGVTYSVKTRRKKRQTKDELDSIAFLIAMTIAKKGVKPQPFLFPAFFNERPKLLRAAENLVKNFG